MERFFENIIPLIIVVSIVFSIINRSKKAAQKSKSSGSSASSGSSSSLSLKEIILQQIEQQKALERQKAEQVTQQKPKAVPIPQNTNNTLKMDDGRYSEGQKLDRQTLENTPTEMQRHTHDVHINPAYNEGDALNRYTLEGSKVEGQEVEGIGIEFDVFGADDDIEIGKVRRRAKRPKVKKLSGGAYKNLIMNRNSIVNGIIMSEVLSSRGGIKRR